MFLALILTLNFFLLYQTYSLKKELRTLHKKEKNDWKKLETLFEEFKSSLKTTTREQNYLFCKFLDDKLCDFENQMRQKESLVITKGYENSLEPDEDRPKEHERP